MRKTVIWSEQAEQQKQQLIKLGSFTPKLVGELEQVLALDPRPAYQHDDERIYGMLFGGCNVKFSVSDL